ncbi:hypothetical protein BN1321_380042 [Staphylococcus aureus]|uniref:Uncharacterized protein n=1 Tax=Staphylococcus aureus TaxID=1280 RepID=A0A0U1MS02_STAAU|nr:hypothetical protein BN1321_380042 [Staphylococcus aureus]
MAVTNDFSFISQSPFKVVVYYTIYITRFIKFKTYFLIFYIFDF